MWPVDLFGKLPIPQNHLESPGLYIWVTPAEKERLEPENGWVSKFGISFS